MSSRSSGGDGLGVGGLGGGLGLRLAASGTESHGLGEGGALLGVLGRDHRVVGGEAPLGAVLVRRHAVLGAQVALERLERESVFEADDAVGVDGLLDRNGGLQLDGLGFGGLGGSGGGETGVDGRDGAGDFSGGHIHAGDDLGGERGEVGFDDGVGGVGHVLDFPFFAVTMTGAKPFRSRYVALSCVVFSIIVLGFVLSRPSAMIDIYAMK